MTAKRVIPCLDVDAGRVVKGVRFRELRDAGDPAELAALYDREGADELVFLDITATSGGRKILLDAVGMQPVQRQQALGIRGIGRAEAVEQQLSHRPAEMCRQHGGLHQLRGRLELEDVAAGDAILAIALLVVLPSPWNLVAFLLGVPVWIVELLAWNRTVKHRRQVVGAQTLIGKEAIASTACRPRGQVRLDGETWEARCDAGAAATTGPGGGPPVLFTKTFTGPPRWMNWSTNCLNEFGSLKSAQR